ncbi:putative thioredoxin [Trypanosoma cruzi]|uniref:Thioredoxin n=2 Tax=Trypanosoma cruzi TaxID=5693 RepID=Q4DJ25_TRYCC|nr:thioredoxin, putative [Trypanosoma cruzi]AAT79533.1 thioredoxin [Trypanosoma cruzi]EAN92519.1 thioredoxin, putative [Trypanosoma cruzi]PWV14664.1 putative thioredoxin [Trypanosoma cruzi]RNC48031.1 thioredoxin [Trypanosoma cruzi]|eukprot:XP_814370.1 thioredoxin [Trypanosoma cruzi strain CL Brener]
MPVVDVYSVEQFREIVNEDLLTVAWFTAVWCGPCKTIERAMEKITFEFPTVRFAKVDADNNSEIVSKCKVLQLPTFMLVKNGKLIGYVIGANLDTLKRKIREIISNS